MISKQNASRIMRVMNRIQQQIDQAAFEKRYEDMFAMAKLYGGLQYLQFEHSSMQEL